MLIPQVPVLRRKGFLSGTPKLWWPAAPRGLVFSAAFSHPTPNELTGKIQSGNSPTLSSSPGQTITKLGQGFLCNGGTQCISWKWTGQPPMPFSMEALIVDSNPTALGFVCGFNGSANGQNSTYDRSIFGGTNGWTGYIYDGSQKFAADGNGSFAGDAGMIRHLVMTADGSNLRLYQNGVLVATTAAGNAYAGYSTAYFCVGVAGEGGGSFGSFGYVNFASCAVHLANIANVAWSSTEVFARWQNYFAHLIFPEDYVSAMLGGVAAAAIVDSLGLSIFRPQRPVWR